MLVQDRRAHFRKGLSTLYIPFYDALCEHLGPEWQPYTGMRTFEEQDSLYAKGRTIEPIGIQNRVTNAPGGKSAHNYGCATDWTYFEGEKLLWLSKDDPKWRDYLYAISQVGLRPGAEWGDIDHSEIWLDCDWPHILLAFQQGGMTAAQNHIAENMLTKGPPSPTI